MRQTLLRYTGEATYQITKRGADGFGLPAVCCPICHVYANVNPAGVLGDPIWHLAPREMGWEGKTLGEICAQIKDPARSGVLGGISRQLLASRASVSARGARPATRHNSPPIA
jgi:hypothetical protein